MGQALPLGVAHPADHNGITNCSGTMHSPHPKLRHVLVALAVILLTVTIGPTLPRHGSTTATAASAITYQNGGPNYRVNASVDSYGDDYPAALKSAAKDALIDPWRFYNRECTSFVAWRLNEQMGSSNYPGGPWKFSNFMVAKGVPGSGPGYVQFGNAGTWDAAAAKLGYVVDANPAVGAVAQWRGGETSYNWSGSAMGHVGIVVAVAPDGTITMASYNASVSGGYDLVSNIKAPRYLHIADLNNDPRIPSFVDAAYTDFLNRPPTSAEMTFVSTVLRQGSASYVGVALQLATSPEWVSNLVDGFYEAMFARAPDPSGEQYWTNAIISGTPVPNVVASLYGSPEYYARANGTDPSYVTALYQAILGRQVDPSGLQYWTGQISTIGRGGVALSLYQSLESRQNRVTALYQHLLGRPPDPAGLTYWAGQILTSGDLALAANLASSTEYLNRAQSRFPNPMTQG